MHGPQTVSGAFGVGRVEIKFVQRPKKPFPFGAIAFFTGVALIVFQVLWMQAATRRGVVVPAGRAVMGAVDWLMQPPRTRLVQSGGGVQQEGSIERAASGAAVLTARSAADVVYLQGYFHASERVYQMDISRRLGTGELAELLGGHALGMDMQMRAQGLPARAEEDWAATGGVERALLEQYSAGVNAYLQEGHWGGVEALLLDLWKGNWGPGREDRGVRAWRPQDSLVLLRLQASMYAHGWQEQVLEDAVREGSGERALAEAMAGADQQAPLEGAAGTGLGAALRRLTGGGDGGGGVSRAGALGGSVVAITSTADSPALLAAAVHGGTGTGAHWIQNHLRVVSKGAAAVADAAAVPDTEADTLARLDVSGLSVPGIPFVLHGASSDLSFVALPSATPSERLVKGRSGASHPSTATPSDPSTRLGATGSKNVPKTAAHTTDTDTDTDSDSDSDSDSGATATATDRDTPESPSSEVFWVADMAADGRGDGDGARAGFRRHVAPSAAGVGGRPAIGAFLKWPIAGLLCTSHSSSCARTKEAFVESHSDTHLESRALGRSSVGSHAGSSVLGLLIALNTARTAKEATRAVAVCRNKKCPAVLSVTVADAGGAVGHADSVARRGGVMVKRAGTGAAIVATDGAAMERLARRTRDVLADTPTAAGLSFAMEDSFSAGGAVVARLIRLASDQLNDSYCGGTDAHASRAAPVLRHMRGLAGAGSLTLVDLCRAAEAGSFIAGESFFDGHYRNHDAAAALIELTRAKLIGNVVALASKAAGESRALLPVSQLPHSRAPGLGLNMGLPFVTKTTSHAPWAFGGLLRGLEHALATCGQAGNSSRGDSHWTVLALDYARTVVQNKGRPFSDFSRKSKPRRASDTRVQPPSDVDVDTERVDTFSASDGSLGMVPVPRTNRADSDSELAAQLVGGAMVWALREQEGLKRARTDKEQGEVPSLQELQVPGALLPWASSEGRGQALVAKRGPYVAAGVQRVGVLHEFLGHAPPPDWPMGAPDGVARAVPGGKSPWGRANPLACSPGEGAGPAAVRLILAGGLRRCSEEVEEGEVTAAGTWHVAMWPGQPSSPGALGDGLSLNVTIGFGVGIVGGGVSGAAATVRVLP